MVGASMAQVWALGGAVGRSWSLVFTLTGAEPPTVRRPPRFNLEFWKGTNLQHAFIYRTGSSPSSPGQDFTGWSAELVVEPRPIASTDTTQDSVLASSGSGLTLGTEGEITVDVAADVTEALAWDLAGYSLIATDTHDTEVLVARGSLRAREL